MWFWILVIVAVIGAIIGYASSNDGERGAGAFAGCLTGAGMAGSCLARIFIAGVSILLIIWLFGLLFG